MKSKVAERMMTKMPEDIKIFVDKYADIVIRINQLLKEKGFTQKKLAEKMNKKPSEISKWLGGDHNFTLRSIARLEAELGENILYVPRRITFQSVGGNKAYMTVYRNGYINTKVEFTRVSSTQIITDKTLSNVS